MANLHLIFTRENDWGVSAEDHPADWGQFLFSNLVNFNIAEKFRAGLMAYYWLTDEETLRNITSADGDYKAYVYTFIPDPAVEPARSSDQIDRGDNAEDDDPIIRFRTFETFQTNEQKRIDRFGTALAARTKKKIAKPHGGLAI